ncbi:HK97 gp10 family phage protein [Avibacterium sp. 20-15]|uniref:HK97 gp10 family phage protein n=1 Tax=unclassified Avibacterium TaxID=2685287 RepID=UPI002027094B|nr:MULTISPECIES: HK97 gp10 family phage protein [unclassified Avibacterium]MCW9731912.1 HK97 gp10 family phage protein [Avibacterium sp. 20-15]URL04101.1 HK97 gp10 family phage protein [Avibacterium sp. 20-132]
MGKFSIDVGKFVVKSKKKADIIYRKLALETYQRVKDKTPIDTGQLKRSWTVAVNTPATKHNGTQKALTLAELTDAIYITTDKPYAEKLEYGLYPQPGGTKTINGFSTQAPQGMVRITAKEIADWVNSQRW